VVRIDFRRCDPAAFFAAYQRLAVLLHGNERRCRVLLCAGTEDAEMHYTLRDMVMTLARIGAMPAHVQVALVARSPQVKQVVHRMGPPLRTLGCELELFKDEAGAVAWLQDEEPTQARGQDTYPGPGVPVL
jgi:hypothetical protein